MSEKPCDGCEPDTYTRAEKFLALVGLVTGIIIGYMAVDIMTGGRVSAALGSRLAGRSLGRETEAHLRMAADDRHG